MFVDLPPLQVDIDEVPSWTRLSHRKEATTFGIFILLPIHLIFFFGNVQD